MRTLRTRVVLTFYAEYPDNDCDADDVLDRICDELAVMAEQVRYVLAGSSSVDDADTMEDE